MKDGTYKYLDVSTGHITSEDNDKLGQYLDPDMQEHNGHEIIVYGYEYGYFIPIYDALMQDSKLCGLSDSFRKIVKKAKRLKCNLIRLDCDAEYHDDLDLYDW